VTRSLLLDEMLSPAIAEQLRARGLDVFAITERPDLYGLSDEQVLGISADEDRVVVTLNIADFAALHSDWQAQGRSHGGIAYLSAATIPQDRSFLGSVVRSLETAHREGALPGRDETQFPVRR